MSVATEKIKEFAKKETVLLVSFVCALLSSFFVTPSSSYLDYIDYRTLGLLFCLMAAVQGMNRAGLIDKASDIIVRNSRIVCLMLIIVPFFASMIITNDVVLIAFVPFAIMTLTKMKLQRAIIPVVVFQTIAANLGSSATVIGNPQNLYIYSHYGIGMGEFTLAILAVVILGFVIVSAVAFALSMKYYQGSEAVAAFGQPCIPDKKLTFCSLISLFISIMTVFGILDWRITLVLTVLIFLYGDRKVLLKVDYFLLLTFVCFFIFSGNIGNIEAVKNLFTGLMDKSAFFTSLLASQVISNVPSAVLLSGFTNNWKALLMGVDVGGLGTPIASLASLISFKFYSRSEGSRPGKYMIFFLVANFLILGIYIGILFLCNMI